MSRPTRKEIFAKSDDACAYCGGFAEHIEHVIPQIAGGLDTIDNLVGACAKCNYAASGWVFKCFEAKKRYILLHRFGDDIAHARQFRKDNAVWGNTYFGRMLA